MERGREGCGMKWVEEASHMVQMGQRGGGRSPAEKSEGKGGMQGDFAYGTA